jgi:hypothetical protein
MICSSTKNIIYILDKRFFVSSFCSSSSEPNKSISSSPAGLGSAGFLKNK